MAKLELNKKLNDKSDIFIQKLSSEMFYQADFSSDFLEFNWIDVIEYACPYIDNIFTNPKVALVKEEDVVKVERAKKISVSSIKDLSRHTHYIEKIDEITHEVTPSKILIERSEETFNTYENKFIFTLIYNLSRFIMKKEKTLENIKIKDEKVLEYAATTHNGEEKINIEMKITANEVPDSEKEQLNIKSIEEKLEEIYKKLELINKFIFGWQRSELYITLDKANIAKVTSPIKRTNVILKNPNFQAAIKLWDFLQSYEDSNNENKKEGLDTTGDGILKSILNDAFLMEYFVLDSISSSKREQKKRISEYAVILMYQQIKRVISILLNNGTIISEQEILNIITEELKKEKNKAEIDGSEIKNKFKNAIDEYLEKARNYL
ncbi:MAG: DUF2357 domain-containing protein [Bacilli bacterium]|nr:DUF2357 domain-containing protein [Bacilli bacterium]